MTHDQASLEAPATGRVPVRRHPDDQVVAGLAGGIAAWLGIEAIYVRAAFVVLTLVWGVGLLVYLGVWAATAGEAPLQPESETAPPAGRRQRVGLVLMLLGMVLALRSVGLWPGDAVVWPASAIVFGAAFLLDQREVDSREALLKMFDPHDGRIRTRAVLGVVLLVAGLGLFGSAAVPEIGTTLLAVGVTGIGLSLVFGPWIWRLAGDLGVERRERIRQEERAEMAAHLHDSVLQTLALIQRAGDPRRMMTLARAQERELRSWLYERAPQAGEERLSSLLRTAVDRVEADFDVPVEVVTVGDAPVDDRMRALAGAAGEALTNAAKHSRAARVSLFVEVADGSADVFVVDQGVGFDSAAVNGDRKGIAESIRRRMARHGGTAEIHSEPGEGTEVHLAMPVGAR